MSDLIQKENVTLPSLPSTVLPAITELTTSLGIPRSVLASEEEIEYAWRDLPRELREIPGDLRGELVARMCVAVSTGLFDGAMNYIWNAAVLHLRQKIRNFGLAVVAQIRQGDFEEKHLMELQDSRLLELCLKLNIINEDGFFFLDQCRDVRNNFSAAHPTMGTVNDREFTTFLNRCVRYALADSSSPTGVDISAFISAVKGPRFNKQQCDIWIQRLKDTHEAQRQLLVKMVHGIYCDPATAEQARLNALDICDGLKEVLTNAIKSELINNHTEYVAKGFEDKHTASQQFFEKLGFLGLLNESEQHTVFSKATTRLWNAHNGMNNFYNEPPFAERLLELTQQGAVPETIQEELVHVVSCCAVGNGYGVSNAAVPYYTQIIQGFSPREIAILVKLASSQHSDLGRRLANSSAAKRRLKTVLALFDPASISDSIKSEYDKLVK
ncbi:Uncharacterised protein [Vibrio mimicus]|uniref:hypothetical protein n=1 Tax=Vibrio mimicus TaxID=674 RepID=UPI0002BB7A1E|nr:hypothetical protein [Vibrio mimicus]EMB48911.1 hypothetical protein D908_16549 [Vibrio mimicus CAIM 602]MBY7676710.1 hypothetical protein [Vibrio mimicus]MBY7728579.1 hypothetical protein [Vibrio mimicus]TXY29603.1 hypothetical protein FXE86_14070 [Vibrio mimicus]SUQ23400.1 Uncharacterised protein [Vibrio mimicus]